ncbi:uncharacterized protein AMSG_05909 [Thecamonas trahens ATCC 50062]|uniref:Uncharacterized protein n=1 Tax=Thecamonas trahens ATCC 50062 TaxID=461836 RepID=A0A0L0DD55_THETB|nr:hypothetical protein AMSG_05909 [Thecamonas trahens ATCC 50062]KNC50135.1 hypothetical protein AMSG_05909 [Thecamonas trahens ATCC 50062]|eukprot:XP_013757292.1 hypothetical protein AMSG_05909 [Thecamonas trahens ATCC 50062]
MSATLVELRAETQRNLTVCAELEAKIAREHESQAKIAAINEQLRADIAATNALLASKASQLQSELNSAAQSPAGAQLFAHHGQQQGVGVAPETAAQDMAAKLAAIDELRAQVLASYAAPAMVPSPHVAGPQAPMAQPGWPAQPGAGWQGGWQGGYAVAQPAAAPRPARPSLLDRDDLRVSRQLLESRTRVLEHGLGGGPRPSPAPRTLLPSSSRSGHRPHSPPRRPRLGLNPPLGSVTTKESSASIRAKRLLPSALLRASYEAMPSERSRLKP